MPSGPLLRLLWLSAIFGYAVYHRGGVDVAEWNQCLFALGLVAVFSWWPFKPRIAPPLDRWFSWVLLLLPLYVAFQLLPLPQAVLRLISPARAKLVDAVAGVLPGIGWEPLSVAPSVTLQKLVTLAAYIVVFLLVRELAWNFSAQPWIVVFPLLVVVALEAVTGLTQAFSGVSAAGDSVAARGTYVNRNHFAGLLNMAAPFAVVYPVAVLRKNPWMRQLSVRSALKISLGLIVAALLLLGVLYSVSRMGLFSCAASLLIMSIAGVGPGLSARRKWLVRCTIGVLVLVPLVFLAPVQMILRFADMSGSGNLTADGHLALWRETGSLIAAYPVFGCGLGGYEAALNSYKVTAPLLRYDYAHNDYLQLLAELGLVGFALLAALATAVVINTLRVAVNRGLGDHRYIALACLGSFSAIALHSMTDFNLYIQANAMELAWVGGLAAGLAALTSGASAD